MPGPQSVCVLTVDLAKPSPSLPFLIGAALKNAVAGSALLDVLARIIRRVATEYARPDSIAPHVHYGAAHVQQAVDA